MSFRRRSFYGQSSATYRDRAGTVRASLLNLVVLWDFDPLFNLSKLWLACPLRGGEKPEDVLVAWNEEIPYPTYAAAQPMPDQDRVDDELERLLTENEDAEDVEDTTEKA